MERCKTCRHWESRSLLVSGIGRCGAAEDFGYSTPADAASFGVYNDPQSGGSFMTGPEFGCVKWEPKP